jgi:uncharacterized protein
MRIGVLSDTHQPYKSPKNCLPLKLLEVFKDVSMIIHAGDVGDPACLETLRKVCPDVRAVWGNMDPLESHKRLHEKLLIPVGKRTIGLTHGYGNPAQLVDHVSALFKDDKVDIIVFGHSHQPMNETRGGILYFNPGSPTDKTCAPYNSFGIIEIDSDVRAQIIRL